MDKQERSKKFLDQEFDTIFRLCPEFQEPALTILRAHLLTEYYMDRIILLKFPRGDKISGDKGLSFRQKVLIIAALDVLPDRAIGALRNLNTVRNRLAHEMDHDVTKADVEQIGRCFGKIFTMESRECGSDLNKLLHATLHMIFFHMTKLIFVLEEQAIKEPKEG